MLRALDQEIEEAARAERHPVRLRIDRVQGQRGDTVVRKHMLERRPYSVVRKASVKRCCWQSYVAS